MNIINPKLQIIEEPSNQDTDTVTFPITTIIQFTDIQSYIIHQSSLPFSPSATPPPLALRKANKIRFYWLIFTQRHLSFQRNLDNAIFRNGLLV